jgi:hypothetical protein
MNSILTQIQEFSGLAVTLFVIFVCVVIFLAIREIMTWYWKIDTMIKNQNETNRLLSEILKEYRGEKV